MIGNYLYVFLRSMCMLGPSENEYSDLKSSLKILSKWLLSSNIVSHTNTLS